MLNGLLSPQHGASSDYRWKRWPPEIEGRCEYTEQAVTNR